MPWTLRGLIDEKSILNASQCERYTMPDIDNDIQMLSSRLYQMVVINMAINIPSLLSTFEVNGICVKRFGVPN